jgi:nitrite reductase/ring-hydroxylating ferredoxin subunit
MTRCLSAWDITSTETGRWVDACAISELSGNLGKKIDADGRPRDALSKVFHAISDLCSHGMASLREGLVENGGVECPSHSDAFDARTKQALTFPCTEGVRVRVRGDELQNRLDPMVSI